MGAFLLGFSREEVQVPSEPSVPSKGAQLHRCSVVDTFTLEGMELEKV